MKGHAQGGHALQKANADAFCAMCKVDKAISFLVHAAIAITGRFVLIDVTNKGNEILR